MGLYDNIIGKLAGRKEGLIPLSSGEAQYLLAQKGKDEQKASNKLASVEMGYNNEVNDISRSIKEGKAVEWSRTGFKDAEGFIKWRNEEYDASSPRPSDYIRVYGANIGSQLLNELGFIQGIAGLDTRLDPELSTLSYNEAGDWEFTPYARKVDTHNGTFYSEPLQVGGVALGSQLNVVPPANQSPEDPEEFVLSTNDFDTLIDPAYNMYKRDIYNTPQAEEFAKFKGEGDIEYFTENTQAQIIKILGGLDLGPEAGGAATTGEGATGTGEGAIPPEDMKRTDGTIKSRYGYLGAIKNEESGKLMSELSMSVEFDGKEDLIPLLVPTLTDDEIAILTKKDYEGKIEDVPQSIKDKAIAHAKERMAVGKEPFFQDGENRITLNTLDAATEFLKGARVNLTGGNSYQTKIKPEDWELNKGLKDAWIDYIPDSDTKPFNMTEDVWNELSFDQQQIYRALDAKQGKYSMDSYFERDIFFGAGKWVPQLQQDWHAATWMIPSEPGKAEEAKKVKERRKWIDDNLEKGINLKKRFAENPDFFREFKANPYEFVKKYENNTNGLTGAPVTSSDVAKVDNNSPIRLEAQMVRRIQLAMESQDIVGFKNLMKSVVGDNRLNKEQQDTLAEIVNRYDGDLRRLKLQQRVAVAGDMLASLDEQLHSQYLPHMLRFIQSGVLDFTEDQLRLDQTRMLLQHEKELRTTTQEGFKVEKRFNDRFETISALDMGKDDGYATLLREGQGVMSDIVQQYSFNARNANNQGNLDQAIRTGRLWATKFIEYNAESAWPGWLKRPQRTGALQLDPSVRFYDAKNNPVTNIDNWQDIEYAQQVDGQNVQTGARMDANALKGQSGVDGLRILFYLSQLEKLKSGP